MNISIADAIAHLSKWRTDGTQVRATHSTSAGRAVMVGTIKELNASSIIISAESCEMRFFFRTTSEYSYQDVREPVTDENKNRLNRYPTVIGVKFDNGDNLEIQESFS
jgi:hypothetical protein